MALVNAKTCGLVLLSAWLLAGCGGDESETAPGTVPASEGTPPSEPALPRDPDPPAEPPPREPEDPEPDPEPEPGPEPEPEPLPLPQVQLTVSPEEGEAPLSVTLRWRSEDAQSCAAEGTIWSGEVALQGETQLRLDAPGRYDFALLCRNARGEGRAEARVEVTDPFAEARRLYERRQRLLRAADGI